jgi:hypothetical protein
MLSEASGDDNDHGWKVCGNVRLQMKRNLTTFRLARS